MTNSSNPVLPVVVGGVISSMSALLVLLITQAREKRRVAIGNAQKIFTDILVPKLFDPLMQERARFLLNSKYDFNDGLIFEVLMGNSVYFPMCRQSTSDTLQQLMKLSKYYDHSYRDQLITLLNDLYDDLHLEFSLFRGESVLWTMAKMEIQNSIREDEP